jgi:hypothetical protein
MFKHLHVTTSVPATLICMLAAGALVAAQQKNAGREQDARRPKMTLRAQPQVAIAPARVLLTAELVGGPDDFEEYYCPSVEWEWGDETSSESTADCAPYEAGKSQIKRRYTTQHQFTRPGTYKLYIHLKQKDRTIGSATTTVQVQPGAGPGSDPFQ